MPSPAIPKILNLVRIFPRVNHSLTNLDTRHPSIPSESIFYVPCKIEAFFPRLASLIIGISWDENCCCVTQLVAHVRILNVVAAFWLRQSCNIPGFTDFSHAIVPTKNC